MSQRHQNKPAVADLVETNRLIQEARKHADTWIRIPKITSKLCIVVYHDAGWSNVEENDTSIGVSALWCSRRAVQGHGVHASTSEGGHPHRLKARSQAGYLIFATGQEALESGRAKAAVMDWRSSTIKRVCRSTFAAETMSAVDALGAAVVMRASLLELMFAGCPLTDPDPRLCPIRCVTDCASLFDTIHKDGTVKLPSERRLVLDLIGFRELLREEVVDPEGAAGSCKMPFLWVPTGHMEVDGLTKKMDTKALRDALGRGTLTIKEQKPTESIEVHSEGWLTNWTRWASGKDLTYDLDLGE